MKLRLLEPHFPDLNLDSPETTTLHRDLIRNKPKLRAWYEKQYQKYTALIGRQPKGKHVELGSGGGFLKEVFSGVTTSSVVAEDVARGFADIPLDAQAMSFSDSSVDSFFLLDVLHHIPSPRLFLAELQRCLKPGGFALFIEPANTVFGRFIYKNFHHEDFLENVKEWGHSHKGPLAQANQATPSIIFERDRGQFEKEFPQLKIESIGKHTFLQYMASGGLSYHPPLPAVFDLPLAWTEAAARPFMAFLATYMDVVLRRV